MAPGPSLPHGSFGRCGGMDKVHPNTTRKARNMAQQTTVTLTDDIDGGKAAETVSFGLDGRIYEIDLSKKNATALRKALGEFTASARHVRAGKTHGQGRAHPGAGRCQSSSRMGAEPGDRGFCTRSGPGRARRAVPGCRQLNSL